MGIKSTNSQFTTYSILDGTVDNADLASPFNVGADAAGKDINLYGAVASYKAWWDANGDTNGAFYFGADTYGVMVNLYGDTTGCGVFWNPSTDTNGTLAVGATGGSKGNDFICYGATNGAYVTWDQSVDDLILAGAARLVIGADAAGTDAVFYGATASYAMTWDASGDTNGALYVGADTYGIMLALYGDVTGCGVFWDPSTDTNGTLSIGATGGSKGNDVVLYGNTNGAYVMWDQSVDDFILAGAARLLVGADAAGTDALFYGATASYAMTWDASGDTNGALYVGADTFGIMFNLYGDVTGCGVFWDPTADTNGTLSVGAAGGAKGNEFICYGATNGNYLQWDQSADDLLLVGTATQFSVAGTTNSVSTATGAINTAGGLGVAQDAFIGGLVNVAGVATFVSQDIHSAGLTAADSTAVIQGMNTFPKLTPTILTSAAGYTLTAAQALSGCISDTTSTGAIAAVMPTVAAVVALIPGYVAGTSFYLDYANPGNQTVTLTTDASTQWTMVGTMTIATLCAKRFLCVINSATTGTVYSLGTATA